jgi:hypothetical protein
MIEENINGNVSERRPQGSKTPAKNEPRNNQGYENARPHTQSWLLPLVHARTGRDTGQFGAAPYPYATFEKTREAMKGQTKSVRYEMMYAHLLHTFEKEQIRRGLRNKINKTFERPRQITVNKASHKNFVTDNDLRKIKPIPQKKYDAILKHMKSNKRYTTTMIALSSSIGVSDIAWTLNVMYRQGLVDRAYEKTTPIIGNAGAKSLRYVYFKLK